MAGRGRGRGGRGNQAQQSEMAEMRRMIEDLSRAVQTLQRRERAEARMEIPEGDCEPFDIPEGSLEGEDMEGEEENPFHGAEHMGHLDQGRLEDRLVHALDLHVGGIKIEIADFFGKMHAEDYLDWEASLEN